MSPPECFSCFAPSLCWFGNAGASTLWAANSSLAALFVRSASLTLKCKRGKLASRVQRSEVEALIEKLIASQATFNQDTVPTPVTGKFRLVYASTSETFRSSIFFWSFKQALAVSPAAENAVSALFRVTGSLPGVAARYVVHEISEREMRSVVDLEIFPGLRGDVVSTGRLEQPLVYGRGHEEQRVRVETTRVINSNYLPVPEVWAAPVGPLLDQVGGRGRDGATASFRIIYGDDFGHVIRVGGGVNRIEDTFVYERIPE
jgi:hypothetical protein